MDMATFAARAELYDFKEPPACGTVGCIAGWGIILDSRKPKSKFKTLIPSIRRSVAFCGNAIDRRAADVFGIPLHQATALFYSSNWPIEFRRKMENLNTGTKAYARVVCRRIDHFIATGE